MVRLNRTHYSLLQAKVLNLSFKIWYGLTVHIIRFYRQNFQFFKIVPSSQIPANYANSAQFAHTVRELGKIRTFLLTFSIMFQVPAPAKNPAEFQRITQIPRNPPTQSANDAKFAPFINIIHYVSDA